MDLEELTDEDINNLSKQQNIVSSLLDEDSSSSSSSSSSSASSSSSSSSDESSSSSSSSSSSDETSQSSSSSSSSSDDSISEQSSEQLQEKTPSKTKQVSQKSNFWDAVSDYYKEQQKFNLKKKEKKHNLKSDEKIEFINKDSTLTAIGKHTNIKIDKGSYVLYDEALSSLENNINVIGNDIIKTKLNILFNIINQEDGIQTFDLKKKELDEILKQKTVILDNYEKMLTRNDRDIELEQEKLNQAMDKYNEDMKDYLSNKSIESLKSALTQVIKVINPTHNNLRELTNDSYYIEFNEDTDEYIVCNEILSIYNQEILDIDSKEPMIIDNEK